MADLLLDGCMDFLGGQDASRIPDRCPENAYYAGINVSVKKGALQPRWGIEEQTANYPDEFIFDPFKRRRYYKEIFETGKFQAVAPYYVGATRCIVIVVAGIIFLYNPNSGLLSVISIADGSHINARARRINWSAAGKYLVIHDYPAFPVIIDGTTARRADPAKMEVPVSTQSAFNENRLFIANNGDEFTGGDPVGSAATPNAPITFEEVFTAGSPYINQIFKLPTSDHNDPITYMGFLQLVDSSTGIGPLIIGTNRAIYSCATQNPRANWDQQQFSSLICYNAGIVGPRAFTNVGSDAFFLSSDGFLRVLSMSRNEQHKWSRIPVSREVENWFKFWDRDLISLGFVSYFKNKLFCSVNPYRAAATDFATSKPISDYAHGGMVVMEMDNFVSLGEASKPTWAGLWTGVRPMDMVVLDDDTAFVIGKDQSNLNKIYKINPDSNHDTSENKIRFVRSKIYTREHDHKDPFQNKEIHSIDFNFDNIQGDFSIEIKYKPSHSDNFFPWATFKHDAPWRSCDLPQDCFINGYAPHQIRDFTLGAPDRADCSPITLDYNRVFKKIQLQLTVEGKYWEIHEYRIKAVAKPQSPNQTICKEFPKIALCKQCEDDWGIPDYVSCTTLNT